MREHLLQFVHILRGSGVRIVPEEVLDCATGMEHIDLTSKAQFKTLLQTTLVKRVGDLETFDRLFDLYFKSFEIPEAALSPLRTDPAIETMLTDILAHLDGLVSPQLRDLLVQGMTPFPSALHEAGQRTGLDTIRYPLQASQFVQRLRRDLGLENWPAEIAHILSRVAEKGVDAEARQALEAAILERVGLLEEMIRDHVGRQTQGRLERQKAQEPNRELMEKSFGALTDWEIRSMQQAVQELAKKIRDEAALRQRRHRRGRFDLKHTLRRNLRYGGIPLEVAFRKRRKSKARIVALCDVSNSVWNASRFMLHLLYSLQDQFDKVRSFVFVDELGEVTEHFDRQEVNRAVETALSNAGIPYNRYTDYGSVFKQFHEEYLEAVNRKTTFIVIGDGRNNFFYPGDDYLGHIRGRARRVIWLNPESRGFWRFGDSAMHRYVKQCDEARECRNLKQLIEFVNQLTL